MSGWTARRAGGRGKAGHKPRGGGVYTLTEDCTGLLCGGPPPSPPSLCRHSPASGDNGQAGKHVKTAVVEPQKVRGVAPRGQALMTARTPRCRVWSTRPKLIDLRRHYHSLCLQFTTTAHDHATTSPPSASPPSSSSEGASKVPTHFYHVRARQGSTSLQDPAAVPSLPRDAPTAGLAAATKEQHPSRVLT